MIYFVVLNLCRSFNWHWDQLWLVIVHISADHWLRSVWRPAV